MNLEREAIYKEAIDQTTNHALATQAAIAAFFDRYPFFQRVRLVSATSYDNGQDVVSYDVDMRDLTFDLTQVNKIASPEIFPMYLWNHNREYLWQEIASNLNDIDEKGLLPNLTEGNQHEMLAKLESRLLDLNDEERQDFLVEIVFNNKFYRDDDPLFREYGESVFEYYEGAVLDKPDESKNELAIDNHHNISIGVNLNQLLEIIESVDDTDILEQLVSLAAGAHLKELEEQVRFKIGFINSQAPSN